MFGYTSAQIVGRSVKLLYPPDRESELPMLMDRIERGDIDPSYVITHRLRLDDAPKAYKTFRDKHEGCVKVVLKP